MVGRLSPVVLLLLLFCSLTRAANDPGEFCTLGGQRHKMGDTWHPTLKPYGQNACVNCTCHKGGKVWCVKIECPRPDCDEPKLQPGECCLSCDDGKEGSEEEDSDRPGCLFHGTHLRDGDVFPSNNTGLRPTRRDQCVMCHCAMGQVLCQLKTCLPTNCKRFKSVPDDCCPQCADGEDYIDSYLHPILSDPTQDNRTDADCTSSMGVHKNGSSWSPVIEMFGEVNSVLCVCVNGNVTCKRLECPPAASLPCAKPRKVPGSPCRVCPLSKGRKDRVKGRGKGGVRRGQKNSSNHPESGKKKKGSKRGRGKKKRKNRKRKNRGHGHRKCKAADKEEVHPERKANETLVSSIFAELCLPRNTDRLVYRVKGSNHDTLAFDAVTDPSVEMLRWMLVNGKVEGTESTIVQAADIRSSLNCQDIIGATNKRGFKKLLKKVESKTRRCKSKKRRCVTKALDKVLKRDRRLKAVPTQRVCGP